MSQKRKTIINEPDYREGGPDARLGLNLFRGMLITIIILGAIILVLL